MIPDETRQHRVLLVVAGHGTHAQVDVGPVETRYDNPRARKAEQFDDVVADLGRGGRGEGRERRSTRLPVCASARAGRVSQKPVVGPEVVTPLRDAMRLVDDEPRDRHVAEDAHEGIRREALGRDIQQAQIPGTRGLHRLAAHLAGQHRVQRRRPNSPLVQLVHLVFHQRDQRRHHQCRPWQQDGGKLKAERLSRSRRHDGQHIVPLHHGAHEVLLTGAKRRVPEVFVKRRHQIDHRCSPRSVHGHAGMPVEKGASDDDGSRRDECQAASGVVRGYGARRSARAFALRLESAAPG